jgi:hypothetical protein
MFKIISELNHNFGFFRKYILINKNFNDINFHIHFISPRPCTGSRVYCVSDNETSSAVTKQGHGARIGEEQGLLKTGNAMLS